MSNENNMKTGIVFQSSASGLWYQNKDAAGEISAVMINGERFSKGNRVANDNDVILPKWLYEVQVEKCKKYDEQNPNQYCQQGEK